MEFAVCSELFNDLEPNVFCITLILEMASLSNFVWGLYSRITIGLFSKNCIQIAFYCCANNNDRLPEYVKLSTKMCFEFDKILFLSYLFLIYIIHFEERMILYSIMNSLMI